MLKGIVLVLVLVLIGAACAQEPEQSMEIADPPSSIEGNVVSMDATLEGIEIVKADGDTSGETGHFHVFIDKEPAAVGEVIPVEAGIVHTAENPIKLYGLSVGDHTLTIVVGNGAHTRFGEDLEEQVTVDVKGPSVDATAPATIDEGEDLEIALKSEGVEIVAADGERSEESGHFHVLVDPESPPEAGEVIPAPEENKIIHTTEGEATVADLDEGEHTLWVVLGDGQHYAFDPPVMDRLTVTVG